MCLSICTMIMNSTATNADDVSGAPISQAELLSVFTMKNNSQWNHEQNKVQSSLYLHGGCILESMFTRTRPR